MNTVYVSAAHVAEPVATIIATSPQAAGLQLAHHLVGGTRDSSARAYLMPQTTMNDDVLLIGHTHYSLPHAQWFAHCLENKLKTRDTLKRTFPHCPIRKTKS